MDFDTYNQKVARFRMATDNHDLLTANIGLGLVGEAYEAFYSWNQMETTDAITDELGDILFYLAWFNDVVVNFRYYGKPDELPIPSYLDPFQLALHNAAQMAEMLKKQSWPVKPVEYAPEEYSELCWGLYASIEACGTVLGRDISIIMQNNYEKLSKRFSKKTAKGAIHANRGR